MRALLAVWTVTVIMGGLLAVRPAAASEGPELTLAQPSGPHPVGRTMVHLVDRHRTDPWLPTRRRELMVSVWYPAIRAAGNPARYTTTKESALLVQRLNPSLPADSLANVAVPARADAPLWTSGRRLPLVLLSPGWSLPRSSLSGLAVDLASRGYAVAAVDHTHESVAIEFPDGHVAECLACPIRDATPPAEQDQLLARVAANRAADLSFVLTELTRPGGPWPGGSRWINRHRIATIGHSAGGAAALTAMIGDHRIRAAASLDGKFAPAPHVPTHRPVLLLGQEHSVPGSIIDWSRSWNQLTGWKRWLTVTGTRHESATDLALLTHQLGHPLQPLPGPRCTTITNTYLAAFLDLHLHHRPQPLLTGPSPTFPEVLFHHP